MTRLSRALALPVAVLAAALLISGGPAQARPGTSAGQAAAVAAPLRAWGHNSAGQLGNGSLQSALVPVKVRLPAGIRITQVRAGCFSTLALASSGRVYAWGDNSAGQLGDGTTITRKVPVRVKLPAGARVTAIRAGCANSFALTSGGRVYAWGYNQYGDLGDGSHHNARHLPVRVRLPAGTTIRAITAGCDHAMAITSAGRLLAWGRNTYGQLGNGGTTDSDVPVRVALPSGAKPTIIAAGCVHSIALTSAGLFAWGFNSTGQLGDGTETNSDLPVPISIVRRGPPLGRLVSLFAGCFHTLALFSKGSILAWGFNSDGELGDGTVLGSDTPVGVELPTGTKAKAISAGCQQSYALTRGGKVLAWGAGNFGALGDGLTGNSETPVAVRLPAGLIATAIGSGQAAYHALALVRRL